jgi:iron(III) transport system permease protein
MTTHPATLRQSVRLPHPTTLIALVVAALVCVPVVAVIWLAFNPEENIWPHLLQTVLPGYVSTTLILMVTVAAGTLTIGVICAWLVTFYEFPGRGFFTWGLLLPFAVPAYVIAYVYTDLLEYAGPVQTWLRSVFGWQSAADYYFPPIRTLGGAATMLTLVLYPYVYLLTRAAFAEQSPSMLDAARVLGHRSGAAFFRVTLPLARPAVAVGVAMVMMETLNDFGTVDYFAVRTLSAGIYDVWLGMNNLGGSAQIASLLLIFVLMMVGLERIGRRRQRHFQPASSRFRSMSRLPLRRRQALLATTICALPVILGFVLPAVVLGRFAIDHFAESWTEDFRQTAINSLTISSIGALTTVAIAVMLAYAARMRPGPVLAYCNRVASVGYSVPGAVLALGVLVPFAAFDNAVDAWLRAQFDISSGLLLSGTVFAVVFAYVVRFMAVALGAVESSLGKITPSMDMAARTLGHGPLEVLRRVHIPLMRSGLLTASLVVFVDCMKELPATLVLRPFNYETLATYVYQYASDELLQESSLAALLIVATGLIPVLLLSRTIDHSRELQRRD